MICRCKGSDEFGIEIIVQKNLKVVGLRYIDSEIFRIIGQIGLRIKNDIEEICNENQNESLFEWKFLEPR